MKIGDIFYAVFANNVTGQIVVALNVEAIINTTPSLERTVCDGWDR